MKVQIHSSWEKHLQAVFASSLFGQLTDFVRKEYQTHRCFPPGKYIFEAFNRCPMDKVKVVILGQDPYHGPGQAHGLAFSVPEGVAHPPSLINIFKEIEADLGIPYPKSGNLNRWADQGVFLLNATLSVRAHQAGSHQKKGWETFTDAVIKALSTQKEPIVFMLWGGYAKKKSKFIDDSKHLIISSGHPSPLSANRGYWFGNKHFSQANSFLKERLDTSISW
jgi:uracil-DNA glycosylase